MTAPNNNGKNIYHIVHVNGEEEVEQILDFVRKTGHLPDGGDPTDGDIEIVLGDDGTLKINGATFTLDAYDDLAVKKNNGDVEPLGIDDAENMVFF